MTGNTGQGAAQRRALIALLAGAVMISFSAVFVKLLDMTPTASGFYRQFIGGFALLGIVVLRKKPLAMGRRTALALIAAALFFALDLAFWHRSIQYVGPGLATLLANFQVFALAVAGIVFFRERLRVELAIAIPLAVAGLFLVVSPEWSAFDPGYRRGVWLGLATAVCYAAYVLFLRSARVSADTATDAVTDIAIVSIVAAGFLFAGSFATGESLAIPHMRDGIIVTAYAIVAQVLGWVLISQSLPHVPASRVGLILLLQPTCAYVWDVLFFGRNVTAIQGAGAALALIAIYLGSRRR